MSHNHPAPVIASSTLTKQERFWLSVPLFHHIFVHTRRYLLVAGGSCLLFGLTVAFASMGWVHLALVPAAGVLATAPFIAGFFLVPCRCGKSPMLTSKGRGQFQSFKPLKSLAAAAGGVSLGLVVFLAAHAHSATLAQAVMVSLFMMIGTFSVAIGWTGKTEKILGNSVVSEQEHARLRALTGSSEDELRELIEYHLKTGDLEQADAFSKRLLSLAEQQE